MKRKRSSTQTFQQQTSQKSRSNFDSCWTNKSKSSNRSSQKKHHRHVYGLCHFEPHQELSLPLGDWYLHVQKQKNLRENLVELEIDLGFEQNSKKNIRFRPNFMLLVSFGANIFNFLAKFFKPYGPLDFLCRLGVMPPAFFHIFNRKEVWLPQPWTKICQNFIKNSQMWHFFYEIQKFFQILVSTPPGGRGAFTTRWICPMAILWRFSVILWIVWDLIRVELRCERRLERMYDATMINDSLLLTCKIKFHWFWHP